MRRSSVSGQSPRKSKRYLGLELAGAKNNKTSVATLEYYPEEKQTFLLDIFDRISGPSGPVGSRQKSQSADEALLELLQELCPALGKDGSLEKGTPLPKLGVNVPLELPPCIKCSPKTCSPQGDYAASCGALNDKWLKSFLLKANKKKKGSRRPIEFTPYTQRPVELWIRHHVMPQLSEESQFEIDETLGGNRAPLTARMHFLKRHLGKISLMEVWPKLTVAILGSKLSLHPRILPIYRQLEHGAHGREEILLHLAKENQIFIYERDMVKLSQNLTAFDAFICAFTALLADQGRCSEAPPDFPLSSGWVQYPVISG